MRDISMLTREEELLLSLCRVNIDNRLMFRITELAREVSDWNKFLKLANNNGVAALCYYNLSQTVENGIVPSETFSILKNLYYQNLTRNSFLKKSLNELGRTAGNEFGRIVLLKGMALESTVYGNIGLRQVGDIDILVEKSQAYRLRKHLLKNGYESDPVISRLYERMNFTEGKHLPEMRRNGINVEIHSKVFRERYFNLTEKMIQKSVWSEDFYIPDPQLLFIYLVSHIEKHRYEGEFQLKQYTDLAVLLEKHSSEILNDDLLNQAGNAGMTIPVKAKLVLLNTFWGFKNFNVSVTESEEKPVAEAIEDFITNIRGQNNSRIAGFAGHTSSLKYIPGFLNKFLFIAGFCFPSVSYMKNKYKINGIIPVLFHYPVRWFDILLWLFDKKTSV